MSEPLVHIVDAVPELDGHSPPLVLALRGFLDAGAAAELAADHLEQIGQGKVIATFAVDEFYDYRARRPAVSFRRDHFDQYDAPRMMVRLMHDRQGAPYLLLRGPEPDYRWEGWVRGVLSVVERFAVSRVITLAGVPMAVPHTRPVVITAHATDPSLLVMESRWSGDLRIPSSADTLLQVRLAEAELAGMGYVAHVPHYISHLPYSAAAVALLRAAEAAAKLDLAPDEFEDFGADQIEDHLGSTPDLPELVAGLERQYDTFAEAEARGDSLLARDQPLPTGEELGAQFESFLADLEGPDSPGRPDQF